MEKSHPSKISNSIISNKKILSNNKDEIKKKKTPIPYYIHFKDTCLILILIMDKTETTNAGNVTRNKIKKKIMLIKFSFASSLVFYIIRLL